MGRTRIVEIAWVGVWVLVESVGVGVLWVYCGCTVLWVYCAHGCTVGVQWVRILDHIQIHCAHNEISHGCNVGVQWV